MGESAPASLSVSAPAKKARSASPVQSTTTFARTAASPCLVAITTPVTRLLFYDGIHSAGVHQVLHPALIQRVENRDLEVLDVAPHLVPPEAPARSP